MLQIFPNKELSFTLSQTPEKSISLLKSRTLLKNSLVSVKTDKTFIGSIDNNTFKLISSKIGTGAFCVLEGSITHEEVKIEIEIHLVFRILLSIFMMFPVISIPIILLTGNTDQSLANMIVVSLLQLLFIRVLIEIVFRYLSKQSIMLIKDVLGIA